MEFEYRCLVCGNNTVHTVEDESYIPNCEKCEDAPDLALVTDENRDSLPQATKPLQAE